MTSLPMSTENIRLLGETQREHPAGNVGMTSPADSGRLLMADAAGGLPLEHTVSGSTARSIGLLAMNGSGNGRDKATMSKHGGSGVGLARKTVVANNAQLGKETSKAPEQGAPKTKRKMFNFQERLDATEREAELSAGIPDNLFSRKAWVVFVLGLISWTYYVFVGRLCAPMMRRSPGAGGSVGEGAGLTVAFNVLWLMFVWTYVKMAMTGPGVAKDMVERSEPPMMDQEVRYYPGAGAGIGRYAGVGGGGRQGQGMYSQAGKESGPAQVQYLGMGPVPPPDATIRDSEDQRTATDDSERTLTPAQAYARRFSSPPDGSEEVDPGVMDGPRNLLPAEFTAPVTSPAHEAMESHPPHANPEFCTPAHNPIPLTTANAKSPSPHPTTNSLEDPLHHRPLPPFRLGQAYCHHCNIYKPHRTHHCRHCGACVLAMDHHCPWVGQCVGWGNHKFFIIFCGWSTAFTAFVLAVFAAKLGTLENVDGQMIALICISALFTFFTATMFTSHVVMATANLTTIESYTVRSQREREQHLLSEHYGFWAWGKKRRTKRRWRGQYGALRTEGNRWWIGGRGREWREVMGDSVVGWILPIGRPKGDGQHYEQNPRFSPEGMRRPREEWPEDLRSR